MSFQWAFHLALLVDSLSAGNYVPVWRDDLVSTFIAFQAEVAQARLHYRNTNESLPHYERFGRLLAGSGSDTADVIRVRHSFLLAAMYPQIKIIQRDPNRGFDALEKEVIWNRDRGLCQNPDCTRPGRRVSFREATIHHVIEHTTGGRTTLENGILVCPECHAIRTDMQRLAPHFQAYLARIYANAGRPATNELEIGAQREEDATQADSEDESNKKRSRRSEGRLTIVIDWGALDVDRETQTISEDQASDSIVKLVVELIGAFGKPMEQQLTEMPVARYPLSRSPATAFVNRATGKPIGSLRVPGTDLYFCPISSNPEKVTRLRKLFSLLTLPDGRGFPPASVEVSIDADLGDVGGTGVEEPQGKGISYITAHSETLRQRHYITSAMVDAHWYNFFASRMEHYRNLYGDEFCLVINCSKSHDDAYVLPYKTVKDMFVPEYLNGSRWVGNVREHNLTVSRGGMPLKKMDIGNCHNAFELLQDAPQPVPPKEP